MDRYPHILGCLWGTAVADAVGLRREGLSRRRAERMYGRPPLRPQLCGGWGFCSDDTEHTQMVGWALARSGGDPADFARQLAQQLRWWMITMPAGTGWATLRACLRLCMGFGPERSGVYSAGNGPAMRAALLGLCADSDSQLRGLVRASARITHTDPRAEEGALVVALAARNALCQTNKTPPELLKEASEIVTGDELRRNLAAACEALAENRSPVEFADAMDWSNGVSGYINHTVPAALYCWARSPHDFRRCVENAVMLGGDTDSVAAIAGAVCGANLGAEAIPPEWINDIVAWPRTFSWMQQLARAIDAPPGSNAPPSMRWWATLPRNILFAAIVLPIGFRRLLPPY